MQNKGATLDVLCNQQSVSQQNVGKVSILTGTTKTKMLHSHQNRNSSKQA